MVAARSSRGDALFHLAMLGCVLGGGLFAGSFGDHIWQSSNQGVRVCLICATICNSMPWYQAVNATLNRVLVPFSVSYSL